MFKLLHVKAIAALIVLTVTFICFQNFSSSYIKTAGQSYVYDSFESSTRSNAVWMLSGASCNQILHKDANGKYPLFGQTARPGYCDFRYESDPKNTFLRFITHPFDRRDAAKNVYKNSVDQGKGGSETRAKGTFSFNSLATGKSQLEGWDLGGDYYATPTNTIRYSFDFRIYNMSILEDKLANEATVVQFHQGAKIGEKSCGAYYAGSAPSPGLYTSINPTDPAIVDFKLSLKLFEQEIPSSLVQFKRNCIINSTLYGTVGPNRSICEVIVWSASYPKIEVLRKWFSVSIIMKNSTSGTLDLFFGSRDSTLESYKYKRQAFVNSTSRLYVPTTMNSCPAQIYLGNYVLGYTQLDPSITSARVPLYGLQKPEWLGLTSSANDEQMQAACTTKPAGAIKWVPEIHRYCKGDQWVSDRMIEKYGKFINYGSYTATETPPQLITDYDNFRIVQQ